MKLKKFEALTEKEAIDEVKKELGPDALVLSIKKIKPKGISSWFRKPYVEVTAAFEDTPLEKIDNKVKAQSKEVHSGVLFNEAIKEQLKSEKNEEESYVEQEVLKQEKKTVKVKETEILELEKKVDDLQELLDKAMSKLAASEHSVNSKRIYENNLLQFFYDNLISQGVLPELAEELLEDISEQDLLDINSIVKVVYKRIIEIIGTPNGINAEKKGKLANNVVFIGPTGVGKTTSIIKLSSNLIINQGKKVGFITTDTYRIAAIEQLKTYADILNCDVEVVYNSEDLVNSIKKLRPINDLVFIDTAGHSHKNEDNINELESFLKEIKNAEIYLVLSVTTKYEDLINIINCYSKFVKFKLILTKLDETICLGSILNIRKNTDIEITYVAMGQNVPDDIDIIRPEKVAKALLGSMYK